MLNADETQMAKTAPTEKVKRMEIERGELKVPVVKGQALRSGVPLVVGSIGVSDLLGRYKVPYRDSLRKEGYQRKPQESRISRFATALTKNRVDVPTSILMNIRGEKAGQLLRIENGQLFLEIAKEDRTHFYVVDGQHRVEAFRKVVADDFERWKDERVQFVLMIGASEQEEMDQFYVVNTEAKSVRTDLAQDLLKQRAEADSRVLDEAIERGQDWRIEAQAIVEILNQTSNFWSGRIRLANAEKGATLIPSASFVTSLRSPLVKSPFFSALNREDKIRVLDAYWKGVRTVLREPFDEDPDDYTLQKGIGVTALHEVLLNVLEILRSKGESVFDADAYARVVDSALIDLEGENTKGEPVRGSDFWLGQKMGGAAGTYSSSAGKRVLAAKIKSRLPAIRAE